MDRELLLLGLLRQEKMHGYRLSEFIERDMSACIDLKKSTAYFLLDKMAQRGWVTQRETRAGNRPPRRVYRVTAKGEVQFQKLLRENLTHYSSGKFAGDIGLAFSDVLDPEETLACLHQRRAALVAELEAALSVPQHCGSLQLIVEHQIVQLESELQWLDKVIVQFKRA